MSPRTVHQVLVGAGRGDAITSMALSLRDAMRHRSTSEVYAYHVSDDITDDVLPLAKFGRGRRDDVIVYHSSFGEPNVTKWLMDRPEKLVIVYHNITPPDHFLDFSPQFAANLLWGRHELQVLRDRVALAVAVSAYNAADLEQLGYTDVHVVSAGLKPSRLASVQPSGELARRIRGSFPHGFVLSVSQMLPHKRFETLIEAMHLVQWVHEQPLGLAIVGHVRDRSYDAALQRHARRLRLDRVWFFGRATDAELSTFYRMASVYAITSAHEGLALPPLEAMSFGVPVVARAAGALADTIRDAGLVLPETSGPVLFGEAIAEVAANAPLRQQLCASGAARIEEIERQDPSRQFMSLLDEVPW